MRRENWRTLFVFLCLLGTLAGGRTVRASEADALAISANIQSLHMPYGTLLDPVFGSADPASPGYTDVVSYARAGDSAIWTGHYLAAESFRYGATRSPEALANAWRALQGIHALLDITGTDLLARFLAPADSPYAAAIQQEEGRHGIHFRTRNGQTFFWIGNTSRDQYSGVLFGLSVAYDLIDDPGVRAFIRSDVTRMLEYLLSHNWNVILPDGTFATTFLHRPDQRLAFLQIGLRINPARFALAYAAHRSRFADAVAGPVWFDSIDDHNHYFKFNLNYVNLFSLLRLEKDFSPFKQLYRNAYTILRNRTEQHGNAFFNMVDRVLRGENSARDAETVLLLDAWLQRPRRDIFVDLRGQYPACGEDRACTPIAVSDRVNTDFLWQRSPFLLFGGGVGTRETAAVDYILPYWMARLYGVLQ